MVQTVSPFSTLHSETLKAPSWPILLVERVRGLLTLSVFSDQNGKLFGTVNHRFRVPLKGFPSTVSQKNLPNAIKTLSEGILFWSKEAITFQLSLLGGAPVGEVELPLGHHPLALTLAAAYMKATETSFADYLSLFEQEQKNIQQDGKGFKDYPVAIGAALNLSLKKIQAEMPEALELLYRSTYVASDNIPKSLFFAEGQESLMVNQWLQTIQKYGLFTIGQKEETYSVHPHVQAIIRGNLTPSQEKNLLKTLQTYLTEEWEFSYKEPSTWPKAKLLHTHLLAFSGHGKKDEEFLPQIATFLYGLGLWNKFVEMNLDLSIEYFTQSLVIQKGVCGEEHPDVAACLDILGVTYLDQGDLSRSIDCLTKSLAIREKVYGSEHRSVAANLTNLGVAYKARGDLSRAIEFQARSLELMKKLYGERHRNVAVSLGNLGVFYEAQGDFSRAIKCHTQSLEIDMQVCGEEHPNVAFTLSNLGVVYAAQGDLPQANNYFTKSLAILKKAYGVEHPTVTRVQKSVDTIHEQLAIDSCVIL